MKHLSANSRMTGRGLRAASHLLCGLMLTLGCMAPTESLWAQTSNSRSMQQAARAVQGTITADSEQGEVIPYAVVSFTDVRATIAGKEGEYTLENIQPGTYEVEISSLGYETLKTTVTIVASKSNYDFKLKPANFYVEDVVVSARASSVGAATASTISRTAIDHLQANSLADVMQLIPGADITSDVFKPDMTSIKTPTIRGGAALGTAIIMDGAPISNTANLQEMAGAAGGEGTGTRAIDPTSGIDMRTITTDNIESIEVIRGVASAEYGDAASGAVIINTKAGREPLAVRFNTNPNVYSLALNHGIALGQKKGFLNYGADYAYSTFDPRESYDTYQRATARVAYSNTFLRGRLSTNTSLSFLHTKDEAEPNPDDEYDYTTHNQKDWGIRFATNGTFTLGKGGGQKWSKSLKYSLSFNYTDRTSYYADKASNARSPYTNAMVDGTVISSIAGKEFTDIDGNKITNFDPSMSDQRAWVTQDTYDYHYNVYGQELNTYAKLTANFAGNLGSTRHRIVIGGEFRSDGNVGDGKVYDVDNPPYRPISYNYASRRERAYKDIPFMNQLSAFAEETFRMKVLQRELEVVAGVRYDHLFDFGGEFSPRFNASYELIPERLAIRGAFGITHKAPSLAFVHPENAYFDYTNFDNSNAWNIKGDAQKFQIITTHAYDIKNHDLEMAKTTKQEIGLDFTWKKMRFSVTAYRDESHNGYSYAINPENVKWVDYKQYKISGSYNADGVTLPDLMVDASKTKKMFLEYTSPANTAAYERQGIEFDLDFGRVDAIRTSFILNGEFYDNKSWDEGFMLYNFKSQDPHVDQGIYSSKISNGIRRSQNLITNLIVTHNIPKIGFVITMTANVNWRQKSWRTYGLNPDIPLQYLSIADGKIHEFDPAWANPASDRYAEFQQILYNKDNGGMNDKDYFIEPSYDPVMTINLNLTKQFRNFDVSFFAHNLFRSTPVQAVKKYPGQYTRRNSDVYFFGLQLTAKIK